MLKITRETQTQNQNYQKHQIQISMTTYYKNK